MRRTLRKIGLALAVTLATVPVVVSGAARLANVSGGGTATFDDIGGLQSQFAIGASVFDDGRAQGHFMCMIVGVVAISGDVTAGSLNSDGSVTVSGVAHGIDHLAGGPFDDCPFEVTFWAGGPRVGKFVYSDCVVPSPGDAETVAKGGIRIKRR